MPRKALLENWVNQLFAEDFPAGSLQLETASADASFRRYFRLVLPDGTSRIVMDAPPDKEDCRPFLAIARMFRTAGVHVPEVLAHDLEQGFLLLSDLGRVTYLQALGDRRAAPGLYDDANQALIAIQTSGRPNVLPAYDRSLLARELALFPDWYVQRHLGRSLDKRQTLALQSVFTALLENNLRQPQVHVHRDYHSRNLMVVGDAPRSFPTNPGILDFQDAVFGPLTYDLVSLYRDAYIDWPEDLELDFVIRYWEAARRAGLPVHADFEAFYRDYEWMGAQRQLKVLGIFARLWHRDGKDDYLKDMPRVMHYLRRTCQRYRELAPLARLLDALDAQPGEVAYTF